MRVSPAWLALVLVGCGGGSSDYIDMVPPEALELREDFGGVAVADFDADGFNDIAVGTILLEDRQLLDSRISVYFQRATSPGSFLPPQHFDSNPNGDLAEGLVAADCLQNGLPDLFTTNWYEGGFRLLANDPAQPGTLMPSVHFGAGPANSTFGRSQAVGDIDADGFPDVVTVTEDSVQWAPQSADNLGSFQTVRRIGLGREDVQLGDINNDGLLDVVVLGKDGDVSESVLVYYNHTSSPGRFLAPRRLRNTGFSDYLGIADYDGNGLVDIAVSISEIDSDNWTSHEGLVIFRQVAPGDFVQTAVTSAGKGVFKLFETANLDNDKFPELVYQIDSDILIFESDTSGRLRILRELTVPEEPGNYSSGAVGLAIGDLDNDTLDDIAVIHGGVYVFMRRPGDALAFHPAAKLNKSPPEDG